MAQSCIIRLSVLTFFGLGIDLALSLQPHGPQLEGNLYEQI